MSFYPNFEDWKARSRSFEGMAISRLWSPTLRLADEPTRLTGARVSEEFFTVLRLKARLGRLLLPSDFKANAGPVAVLRLPNRRSFKAAVLVALAFMALLLACLKLAPRRTGASRSASVQELELELRQLRESVRGSHATRPMSQEQLKEQLRMLKKEGAAGTVSTEELELRLKQLRRS